MAWSLIGSLSLIALIVAILVIAPQIAEVVFDVPPIAERFGTFTSPIDLPVWLNVVLGLCASTASVERATRLRWNSFLDGSD